MRRSLFDQLEQNFSLVRMKKLETVLVSALIDSGAIGALDGISCSLWESNANLTFASQ